MKEYFQKIVAWAKEHPYLAAGILGVFIIVVWLAIRNNWFGGGGNGEAIAVPGGDGGGESAVPDLSSLPDTSALPDGISDIGQSSNPIDVSLPQVGSSLGGYESPSSYSDMYGEIPVSGGDFFGGAPAASPQGASLASVSPASPSASLGADLGSNFFFGNLKYDTSEVLPSRVTSVGAVSAQATAAPSLLDRLFAPIDLDKVNIPTKQAAAKKDKGGGTKTPAQEAGKGAKYTGYINGVYYVKGYPSAPSSIAVQSGAPKAGTAAGGNFFSGQYTDPLKGKNVNTKASTTAGGLKNKKGGSI